MIRCPRCNAQFASDSTAIEPVSPSPGDTPIGESTDYLPVARTSSVAEAGFLCDLLVDAQVNAQLQELDDFDAVSGAWKKMFVVVVPQVQAGQAAERLRREMDASAEDEPEEEPGTDSHEKPSYEPTEKHPEATRSGEHEEDGRRVGAAHRSHVPEDFFLESSRRHTQASSAWLPVAMALVAGGVVSWMASDWLAGDRQAEHSTQQSLLWDALKETGGFWESSGQPPAAQRELRYNAATDVFVLEEDLDGDRRVDRRRVFRAEAGWQR